jgi:hypothetical protein
LPFNADTAIDMVQKQISEAPTPLHVHREGLPDWCETVLERALAKSPADRFQTAEEFREALGKVTGMVMIELTKAFSISLADLQVTPPQPAVLERFGLTPVRQVAAQRPISVSPNWSVSTDSPAPHAGVALSVLRSARPLVRIAHTVTIVIRKKRVALAGSLAAILAGGVTLFAIVALRRPAAPTAMTRTGDAPPPAIQSTPRSTPGSAPETSPAPATDHSMAPAAVSVPTTSAGESAPIAAAPGRPPRTSAASTSAPPDGARGSPAPADLTATDPMPVKPRGRTFAVPFVFEARTLVTDGTREAERECQVVLADGRINVQAIDDQYLVHAVAYDRVLAISYSRGRDPLWNTPAGPAPVARVGGGLLGMFRGTRHWISLRIGRANDEFVVLRVGNDEQARRAIAALEERTGRSSELIVERKDGK